MTEDMNVLNGHALVFAARGFSRSLTDAQRATFLALFSGGTHARAAMEAAVEQADFERGRMPAELPAPLLLAALDYALPRQSAAGSIVGDEVKRKWPKLSELTKRTIRERINAAVIAGKAGMSMDEREWLAIAQMPLNTDEEEERLRF